VAGTESAERFAKRQVKIECPGCCFVIEGRLKLFQPLLGRRRVRPERNRRIAGVTWRRDVVLGRQVSHCITSRTVSTNSLTLSSGVSGATPCPRPQIHPGHSPPASGSR